jgi:hypothetical protein
LVDNYASRLFLTAKENNMVAILQSVVTIVAKRFGTTTAIFYTCAESGLVDDYI